MKKVLSVILSLALLLSCLAFSAVAEGTDYTGDWYLNGIVLGDKIVSPSMIGMASTIHLNADGTAAIDFSQNGESTSSDGTWVITETGLTVTESEVFPMDFVLEDGGLMCDIGEYKMVYTRDVPKASATFPEVVAAESLDVFQGTWKMAYADVNGTMTPKEIFEQIDEAVDVTMVVEGDQLSYSLTMVQQLPVISGPLTLADGQAILSVSDFSVTEEAKIDITINLQMTDAGMIRSEFIVTSSSSEPTVIYLEKVVSE